MMKASLTFAAVAMLTTGCLSTERSVNSYNEEMEFNENIDAIGNVIADGARISGDMGTLRNFDEDATVTGNDEGDYTNLEVIGTNQRGSAMHWFDVFGGMNHADLQPGTHLSFRSGQYPDNSDDLHMEVMVCQGNTAYAWDYDEAAEQVDVDVNGTEDPNIVQIDYTTTVPESGFSTGDRVSSGTFQLHREAL